MLFISYSDLDAGLCDIAMHSVRREMFSVSSIAEMSRKPLYVTDENKHSIRLYLSSAFSNGRGHQAAFQKSGYKF